MKILVTGAAGFIGSHQCDALLASGHSVTGIDNFDPYYAREVKEANLRWSLSHERFHFVELDLRDAAATRALLSQGWDSVIHFAGRGGVRRSILEPHAYVDLNYVSTLNLLESMREANVGKLVFASTSSVYGNSSPVPFREDMPADRPVSPYAATKRACEVLCHAYHHLHGLDVFALRFFTVYGPRQRPDMAIFRFVDAVSRMQPLERHGDGSVVRDFTYVDDIVDAVSRASERVHGYEVINIGGAQTVTLAELIGLIEDTLGKKARIVELPVPQGDMLATQADTSKAQSLLGFSSKVGIEEGLKRFIAWYHEEHP